MHTFHEYIGKQLSERLKKRRVIVLYDPRKEFAPFIDELPIMEDNGAGVARVEIESTSVNLARFQGSFFGLRAAVEPFTVADHPDPLLLYVPGAIRDHKGSILMELEKPGEIWIARDISRRAQWEACRLMAELELQVDSIKPAMGKCGL